ncbi:MAG: histidine kinase, partial [Chloroflexales bacterium]|nr:histidine kinase [Chloroflexales bacterium]
APALAPLAQSDREEALGEWLQDRGVDNGWDLAPALVSAQIAPDDLEQLLEPLPPQAAPPLLAWLNQALGAASLLDQIEQSTQRIAELVKAVKSYTFMDQGGMQEIDLHAGLDSTLAMLNHKLKGVKVVREYDPDLPRILGSGSELNQVWTNLLDNAIDALGGKGSLRLITRGENSFAMVEIADDGPGIPGDVLPRIFEPFFTTKDVGVGSGLGLDIAYRIVRQHNGTIEVQSHPGLTRFIVRLPVQSAPTG